MVSCGIARFYHDVVMILSWFGDGFVMVYSFVRLCVGLYGCIWICLVCMVLYSFVRCSTGFVWCCDGLVVVVYGIVMVL